MLWPSRGISCRCAARGGTSPLDTRPKAVRPNIRVEEIAASSFDRLPHYFSHRLELERLANAVHAPPIGAEVGGPVSPGAPELHEGIAGGEVELGVVYRSGYRVRRLELHPQITGGRCDHLLPLIFVDAALKNTKLFHKPKAVVHRLSISSSVLPRKTRVDLANLRELDSSQAGSQEKLKSGPVWLICRAKVGHEPVIK